VVSRWPRTPAAAARFGTVKRSPGTVARCYLIHRTDPIAAEASPRRRRSSWNPGVPRTMCFARGSFAALRMTHDCGVHMGKNRSDTGIRWHKFHCAPVLPHSLSALTSAANVDTVEAIARRGGWPQAGGVRPPTETRERPRSHPERREWIGTCRGAMVRRLYQPSRKWFQERSLTELRHPERNRGVS